MKKKKLPVAVQSNSLVSARYKLSLGEQRIILMMISKITPNDKDFQGYELHAADVAKLFEMDEKSVHREIVVIASRLLKRPLRIKQVDGSLLICNWIAEAVYKSGILTVKPAPSLKPYLLELKEKFTIIPLEQAGKFKSIYSIRIYQLLKQYSGLGYFEIEVSEFRAMLNFEKRYSKFYELRRCVLDVARKELDCKADLSFTIETTRKGKAITTIKFIIIKNDKNKNKDLDADKQAPVHADASPHEFTEIDLKEAEELDRKVFNEFIEEIKQSNNLMYEHYLQHGRDGYIQDVYVVYLDEWMQANPNQI